MRGSRVAVLPQVSKIKLRYLSAVSNERARNDNQVKCLEGDESIPILYDSVRTGKNDPIKNARKK